MTVRYHKLKSLSNEQAAYLAGIIDGEGTVTLTRRNIYRHRYLTVTVSNCELPLLEYIIDVTGVGKITTKRVYNPKHSPGYTYQVYSRQALDILRIILPYLQTYKKERAHLVLEEYLKLTPRNGKYTDQMIVDRRMFIDHFFSIIPQNAKTRRGGLVRMIAMEMGSIETPVQ